VEDFKLRYEEGKIFAIAVINGTEYEKDITNYMINDNPHDTWLDYRIGIKQKQYDKTVNQQ
jgi:hypothetical protein